MAKQNQYPFQNSGASTLSELTRQYVYNGASSIGIDLTPEETERISNGVMHTLTTSALKACKPLADAWEGTSVSRTATGAI